MSASSGHFNKSEKPALLPRRAPMEKKVRIKVIGVGGAGVNAVDRLVLDGFNEVSFLVVNTDAQALASSVVTEKLQIGENLTHGLGAGGDPQKGRSAAMENIEQIRDLIEGYDLVFVAAGMGGGTGTGAGPVVARVAREEGALVLGLITLPFTHEGQRRMKVAREGIVAMETSADAVIVIPNDKLLALADEKTSVLDAFRPTDEFLSSGVRKIWQMLARTGLINIDFADLRSVLQRRHGETLFGFGEGTGEQKVEMAIQSALSSPLLSDERVLAKAVSVLIGVTHGPDFTMAQLKLLMEEMHRRVGAQAFCKQGIVVDENYADRVNLVVIASTGEPLEEDGEGTADEPLGKADHAKPSDSRKAVPKPESMIRDTSTGLFTGEPFNRRNSRKKSGADEFIVNAPKQETLKLDEATRGLFERVERTMVNGEDLDRPTFMRRGIQLKNL